MRAELRGIPFDLMTEEEAIDAIIDNAGRGRGGRVVTPNVDILRRASRDDRLKELVSSADLVLADGMPVVWALRIRGERVPERVTGSALGPRLAETSIEKGLPLYLIGGNPGNARAVAESLQARWPGRRVGWYCPPLGFEADPTERAVIIDRLREFQPSVCLSGFGFPKDSVFGADLARSHPGCWFVGVGATIDFMAGAFPRAPAWMQASGLEWLFRLALEPRRLMNRYLVHGVPFSLVLMAESSVAGLRSRVTKGG